MVSQRQVAGGNPPNKVVQAQARNKEVVTTIGWSDLAAGGEARVADWAGSVCALIIWHGRWRDLACDAQKLVVPGIQNAACLQQTSRRTTAFS